MAANLDHWEERYRPVLGLLAVARGDGLTGDQIAHISHQKRSQTDTILRRCGQYLAGPDDKGRLRIYHQSFRDFLAQDADFQVYPDEANASIADWYWMSCFDQVTGRHNWGTCDEYGLRHLPAHLAGSDQGQTLSALLLNFSWLQAKLEAADIAAVIVDYNLLPDDRDLRLVRDTLRLSAHLLARNKTQLAGQLLGRLSGQADPRVGTLLAEAEGYRMAPWLRPLTTSLEAPGGPLERTLAGHTEAVRTVAVTLDGRRAISGSHDHSLKVWDLQTGAAERTLIGHTSVVNAVAVAPDGRRAISASWDRTLRVWDMQTGVEEHTLAGHTDWVSAVAVTLDGRRAISGSHDHSLKVWDLQTGAAERTLTGHTDQINAVAVTPDGRRAISTSRDNTLKVWDLQSGQLIASFTGENDMWVCVVAPDGVIIVAGEQSGRTHFLRLEE